MYCGYVVYLRNGTHYQPCSAVYDRPLLSSHRVSVVIVGQGALSGADGPSVLAHAMVLAEGTNSKFMVLHTAAGRVGAMDVGACTEGGITAALDGADVIYNLGADEVEIAHGAFVIEAGNPLIFRRRTNGSGRPRGGSVRPPRRLGKACAIESRPGRGLRVLSPSH